MDTLYQPYLSYCFDNLIDGSDMKISSSFQRFPFECIIIPSKWSLLFLGLFFTHFQHTFSHIIGRYASVLAHFCNMSCSTSEPYILSLIFALRFFLRATLTDTLLCIYITRVCAFSPVQYYESLQYRYVSTISTVYVQITKNIYLRVFRILIHSFFVLFSIYDVWLQK